MSGSKILGYICGVVAAAALGMNPVFALPLLDGGMDVVSILFFRYVLALPAVWILMRVRGRHAAIGLERIVPICGLSLFMTISMLCLFESYLYMDIGLASTLLYVYPVIVMLILVGFFNEILLLRTFGFMIAALAGMWILCADGDNVVISTTGLVFIILSALCYALYIVGINRRPLRSVATLSLTFWVMAFGVFTLGLIILVRGSISFPRGAFQWLSLLLLALIPTVASFVLTNASVRRIGTKATAVLSVFDPITAVYFGVSLFDETLSLRNLVGLVIILVSITLIIAKGNLTRQILAIRKLFPVAKRHHSHR